jgi:hypothetical protein
VSHDRNAKDGRMDGTVLTAAAYDVACSSQEADIVALEAFEAGQFAGVCNRRIKAMTWPRLTTSRVTNIAFGFARVRQIMIKKSIIRSQYNIILVHST